MKIADLIAHFKNGDGLELKIVFGIRNNTFYLGDKIITEKQFDKIKQSCNISELSFRKTFKGYTIHTYTYIKS